MLVAQWKSNNSVEIDFAVKLAHAQEELEKKTESERELAQSSVQPGMRSGTQRRREETASWRTLKPLESLRSAPNY